MNNSKITTRYAKALFELAKEQNLLDKINQEADYLLVFAENESFNEFLKSPIISPNEKQKIFDDIFGKNLSDLTLNFLKLLTENQREAFLKIILLDYKKLYREFLGIKEVELTTTFELDKETYKKFEELLQKLVNSKVELKNKIDKSIIGGFIVRIEDKMLDLSVSSQLKQIKKHLTE